MFPLSTIWVFSDKKLHQYFGMNNIKEFTNNPLSRHDFWLITGPVCAAITLLGITILFWERLGLSRFRERVGWQLGVSPWKGMGYAKKKRPMMGKYIHYVKTRWLWYPRKRISDPETPTPQEGASARPNSCEEALAGPPPPHPREETEGSSIWPPTLPYRLRSSSGNPYDPEMKSIPEAERWASPNRQTLSTPYRQQWKSHDWRTHGLGEGRFFFLQCVFLYLSF